MRRKFGESHECFSPPYRPGRYPFQCNNFCPPSSRKRSFSFLGEKNQRLLRQHMPGETQTIALTTLSLYPWGNPNPERKIRRKKHKNFFISFLHLLALDGEAASPLSLHVRWFFSGGRSLHDCSQSFVYHGFGLLLVAVIIIFRVNDDDVPYTTTEGSYLGLDRAQSQSLQGSYDVGEEIRSILAAE